VFDPAQRSLTFASAGHLPPLLVTGDCSRFVQTEKGIPLGLGSGGFSEVVVDLSKGSRLVLYSDGITEATGPTDQEYGPERLQEHFLLPESTPESVLADVRIFSNGVGLQDDATVIMIRA